jgi:hypothetical protein
MTRFGLDGSLDFCRESELDWVGVSWLIGATVARTTQLACCVPPCKTNLLNGDFEVPSVKNVRHFVGHWRNGWDKGLWLDDNFIEQEVESRWAILMFGPEQPNPHPPGKYPDCQKIIKLRDHYNWTSGIIIFQIIPTTKTQRHWKYQRYNLLLGRLSSKYD